MTGRKRRAAMRRAPACAERARRAAPARAPKAGAVDTVAPHATAVPAVTRFGRAPAHRRAAHVKPPAFAARRALEFDERAPAMALADPSAGAADAARPPRSHRTSHSLAR
ncbi:hypothetical protein WS72_24365 [Burkholderia savannae]|uniref:Uncharacterized protein n=1 Tax=Burkholderia savannae TaxID=1637837 RepID=A0ABR5T479_9BURK|nr:hypothetical protein WS72_24365 [Burkholderia savannae]